MEKQVKGNSLILVPSLISISIMQAILEEIRLVLAKRNVHCLNAVH